jgi:rhodanese-related sulfurtransferase
MRLFRQSLGLAVAGAMLGLLLNAVRSDGVSVLRPFVPAAEGPAECVAATGPARIGVGEAQHLLEARAAVFGDVREAAEYAAGHVVDAVHLPCSAEAPDWLANVAKSSTVVLYGASDADADPVAQSLRASGYGDVRVLSGGFPAWQASGGSAASGPCSVCN